MTASLPPEIQSVFDRFITTEYTTVARGGQPITWPVTPYYRPGDPCIDVTTGLGYPKKANDARANPKVALLFSDPTGCGTDEPPQVLVQGTADVDDRDLDANRERYEREALEKLPATADQLPPKPLRRLFAWYFTRIYVHVRPERVYVWHGGDVSREPELFDARMEEVRSGHDEEPDAELAPATGAGPAWDPRLDELGERYPQAVVSLVAPDGFPFSVRVPIRVDRGASRVRLGGAPVGVPWQPGLACLTAHDHSPDFAWQRNFQVRGDLVQEDDGSWSIVPQRFVGGFELPPASTLRRYRINASKVMRFRKVAKAELRKRGR
ncbi:MAG: pyridoxamine 5'-phosphate oxidase family protein [Thermoleophilaceae bacterium]|nr:pyridoxamine 5'-phosphate oxidase family protein [Thermoleophilaceae bacterium]